MKKLQEIYWNLRVRLTQALSEDTGDVPGWVLVTVMTAGLVVGIWAVAGPLLEQVFTRAINSVVGP